MSKKLTLFAVLGILTVLLLAGCDEIIIDGELIPFENVLTQETHPDADGQLWTYTVVKFPPFGYNPHDEWRAYLFIEGDDPEEIRRYSIASPQAFEFTDDGLWFATLTIISPYPGGTGAGVLSIMDLNYN